MPASVYCGLPAAYYARFTASIIHQYTKRYQLIFGHLSCEFPRKKTLLDEPAVPPWAAASGRDAEVFGCLLSAAFGGEQCDDDVPAGVIQRPPPVFQLSTLDLLLRSCLFLSTALCLFRQFYSC